MMWAIDFDRVVHDADNPVQGRRMGPPIEGAKDALKDIRNAGNEIIIFTVWGGTDQGRDTIKKWMQYYEIPFDSITNVKPNADIFIDDRAVRFIDWKDLNAYKSLAEES